MVSISRLIRENVQHYILHDYVRRSSEVHRCLSTSNANKQPSLGQLVSLMLLSDPQIITVLCCLIGGIFQLLWLSAALVVYCGQILQDRPIVSIEVE